MDSAPVQIHKNAVLGMIERGWARICVLGIMPTDVLVESIQKRRGLTDLCRKVVERLEVSAGPRTTLEVCKMLIEDKIPQCSMVRALKRLELRELVVSSRRQDGQTEWQLVEENPEQ